MSEAGRRREGLAERSVLDLQGGQVSPRQDQLAEEVPVALEFDGVPYAVMMVSPGDLEDFAHGFSLTELGLGTDDLLGIEVQPELEGWRIRIGTREPQAFQARHLLGRSGCGLCGSRDLEHVLRRPGLVGQGPVISAGALETALHALQRRQPMNAATGGLHAAAWCDVAGRLQLVREDIGRHNALDKLVGAMQGQSLSTTDGFAVITSRASYEIAMKAAAAGITLIAAVSAPTALAVDLARACGLTLVGFARPGRQVLYSHPQRFEGAGPA
ncbi:sulfurtransferase FdhD [Arenimonas soli]|uniref:Sulfur carrier protein FdhD n=1 Tax=Arenimonas soli TaxID=2269504 RepID=A0ABQ1HEE4_9GAMM|nr:formate dehydrogenase accessory sulfurtransferase FdhD [Arenimonas soli]GGA73820.1 sulfurtransferase FdhD [Arenimonas soli]